MAENIVACDFGSYMFRCGAITEATPSVEIPSVVGHKAAKTKAKLLRKSATDDVDEGPRHLIGHEAVAAARQGYALRVGSCVEHGVVTKWDDFELLVAKALTEYMQRDPEDLSIIFALPPYNPTATTEKIAQILFESFNVERVATAPQGLCALYASGRTTGIVLESGHGMTTVAAVFDSFQIAEGMDRMNIGGSLVSEHLQRVLYERGYSFSSPVDLLNLDFLKEAASIVVPHYATALAGPAADFEQAFELPDGSNVTLGKERFRCTEVLFQPSIVQSEYAGLAEFVSRAIKRCPIDTRRLLCGSVVLSGGNTAISGFAARYQDELAGHFPEMFGGVHVVDSRGDRTENKSLVWSGVSVVANMSSFESHFVTREQYDEEGPSAVLNQRGGTSTPPPPPDDE